MRFLLGKIERSTAIARQRAQWLCRRFKARHCNTARQPRLACAAIRDCCRRDCRSLPRSCGSGLQPRWGRVNIHGRCCRHCKSLPRSCGSGLQPRRGRVYIHYRCCRDCKSLPRVSERLTVAIGSRGNLRAFSERRGAEWLGQTRISSPRWKRRQLLPSQASMGRNFSL